jgi:hypothetical protein
MSFTSPQDKGAVWASRAPGSSETTDAIRTSIEHAESDPVEVFLPYSKNRMRGFEFGEFFAQGGTPRVFAR